MPALPWDVCMISGWVAGNPEVLAEAEVGIIARMLTPDDN